MHDAVKRNYSKDLLLSLQNAYLPKKFENFFAHIRADFVLFTT